MYPSLSAATRDEGWIYADRSFPAGLTASQYEAAVREAEFGVAFDAVIPRDISQSVRV